MEKKEEALIYNTYKKSGKAVDKLKYRKFQKALKSKFKSAPD